MSSTWLLLSLLTLDGIRAHSTAKTFAYASGVFASKAVVRTWSILIPVARTGPISIVPGGPCGNARGSFRGYDPVKLCECKKTC
jgi:hypothetical protein